MSIYSGQRKGLHRLSSEVAIDMIIEGRELAFLMCTEGMSVHHGLLC